MNKIVVGISVLVEIGIKSLIDAFFLYLILCFTAPLLIEQIPSFSFWRDWDMNARLRVVGEHGYSICFVGVFFVLLANKLFSFHTSMYGWCKKLGEVDIIKLLVLNFFEAWIGAIVLLFLNNFSFFEGIKRVFIAFLWGVFISNATYFGFDGFHQTEEIVAWYFANEIKFFFWFFYLCFIMDDLGIPNLKTLFLRLFLFLKEKLKEKILK